MNVILFKTTLYLCHAHKSLNEILTTININCTLMPFSFWWGIETNWIHPVVKL